MSKYEDLQDWHEESRCPVCKSNHVRMYDDYSTGEGYLCEMRCLNCMAIFNQYYSMTFLGHTDIETREEQDNK